MEPTINEHHLVEYSGQLESNFVSIDIVVGKISKIIQSAALDVFHDEHSLACLDYLGWRFISYMPSY